METFISGKPTVNISLKVDSLFHLLILHKLHISSEGVVAPESFQTLLL